MYKKKQTTWTVTFCALMRFVRPPWLLQLHMVHKILTCHWYTSNAAEEDVPLVLGTPSTRKKIFIEKNKVLSLFSLSITKCISYLTSFMKTSDVFGTSSRNGTSMHVRRPVTEWHVVGRNVCCPSLDTYIGSIEGYSLDISFELPSTSRSRNGLSPLYVSLTPARCSASVCLYNHPESCSPTTVGPRFCSSANLLSLPR